jgi:hypothetical protein
MLDDGVAFQLRSSEVEFDSGIGIDDVAVVL